MRNLIFPAIGLLCSLIMTAKANDPGPAAPALGKLTVHEWGTFTGFAGSDGVHLPFRSGIGYDLPSFVITRTKQAVRLNPDPQAVFREYLIAKDEVVALMRMETPIVYFYTDRPRDVEARVEFPDGALTEFYPPVRSMTPALDGKRKLRDMLAGSSLDWGKIHLSPASASANFPKVEGDNHYQHARVSDAATVTFSDRPGEVHEENFLFYRGLGDFKLPVTLVARENDRFALHNSSGNPISTALLIRIKNGKTRFSIHRNISHYQDMTLPSQESSEDGLRDELVKALAAEGLYEKESRAMVKTWESSWFGEEGTGTRLLYILPRPLTDSLLPLRINPTPDETVRVLVGRIDILTPEQEAKLIALFGKADTKGAISSEEARESRVLGRFQPPAFERAAKLQAQKAMWAVRAAAD